MDAREASVFMGLIQHHCANHLSTGKSDFLFQFGQRRKAADVTTAGDQHAAHMRRNQLEVRAELCGGCIQQNDVVAGFQA